MLSLIFASVLLPAVLGNTCCMPDVYEAIAFHSDDLSLAYNIVRDFKQKKMVVRPLNPESTQEFILQDFDLGNVYTKFKDGTCVYNELDSEVIEIANLIQCGSNGNKTGDWVFGEDTDVMTTKFVVGGYEWHTMTTAANCYPMMFGNNDNEYRYTVTLVNVKGEKTANAKDVIQDVSMCERT